MAKKVSKRPSDSKGPVISGSVSSSSKPVKATMTPREYASLSEFNELCRRFEVIYQTVPEIRQEVSALRDQQSVMQQDITVLKAHVSNINQVVGRLETSIEDLKEKDSETRYRLGTLETAGSFFEKRWVALIGIVSAVVTTITMFALQMLYDRIFYRHTSDRPASVSERW